MGYKRILVSAGDPSGDLILAGVVRQARRLDPELEFVGLAGPAAEAAGVKVIANAKDVAVVGISEVLRNLPRILRVLGRLKRELRQASALLCVDFPDFNLKLARHAHRLGVPVDYIVAPQVWAWRASRIHSLKKYLRRLYPALPFEETLFREAGIATYFLGHPIRDSLPPREAWPREDARRVFCIMPGSRASEIRRHLPLLVRAWGEYRKLAHNSGPPARALLPLAPGWTREAWLAQLGTADRQDFALFEEAGEWRVVDDSRQALMQADFGWIVSGTASLEAALFEVPHILLYRLSPSSAWMIKSLSPYFAAPGAVAGLPNILLGRAVIPELLQAEANPRRLAIETHELWHNPARMHDIRVALKTLNTVVGPPGAAQRIAEDLVPLWQKP